jgi:hypothetical protein
MISDLYGSVVAYAMDVAPLVVLNKVGEGDMTFNSTNSTASQAAAAAVEAVATPLTQLTSQQKLKVTSELMRIHSMVSRVADDETHKDACADKADRACAVEFKPDKA